MIDSSSVLAGTSALVTGGTRGIGRAVVESLAAHGVRVGVLARGTDAVHGIAAEVGGVPLPCDVTDAGELAAAVARLAHETGGPPALVVSCAGAFSLQSVETLSEEELDRHLAVNLKGSILTVRAVLPGMRGVGSGTLVQVGSVAGRKAFPGNAAYSASKFGLRGFHSVLLEELKSTGVRATLLEPAATDTPLWDPMDPDGTPDLPARRDMLQATDVAEAVLFVATRPPEIQIPFLPIERRA